MMGWEWSYYTSLSLFPQFMAPTRDNALVFLIYWRIIKSIVCKLHCYKHLLADECKRHAQLTQENEIRCQADAGKDLHPLVFRSLLDLQAAVLRLNKVRSAPAPPRPHWQSGLSHAPGWPALGTAQQLRRGKTGRERLWLYNRYFCWTSSGLHPDILLLCLATEIDVVCFFIIHAIHESSLWSENQE